MNVKYLMEKCFLKSKLKLRTRCKQGNLFFTLLILTAYVPSIISWEWKGLIDPTTFEGLWDLIRLPTWDVHQFFMKRGPLVTIRKSNAIFEKYHCKKEKH